MDPTVPGANLFRPAGQPWDRSGAPGAERTGGRGLGAGVWPPGTDQEDVKGRPGFNSVDRNRRLGDSWVDMKRRLKPLPQDAGRASVAYPRESATMLPTGGPDPFPGARLAEPQNPPRPDRFEACRAGQTALRPRSILVMLRACALEEPSPFATT